MCFLQLFHEIVLCLSLSVSLSSLFSFLLSFFLSFWSSTKVLRDSHSSSPLRSFRSTGMHMYLFFLPRIKYKVCVQISYIVPNGHLILICFLGSRRLYLHAYVYLQGRVMGIQIICVCMSTRRCVQSVSTYLLRSRHWVFLSYSFNRYISFTSFFILQMKYTHTVLQSS